MFVVSHGEVVDFLRDVRPASSRIPKTKEGEDAEKEAEEKSARRHHVGDSQP